MIASTREKIEKILISNTYGFRAMHFSFSIFFEIKVSKMWFLLIIWSDTTLNVFQTSVTIMWKPDR